MQAKKHKNLWLLTGDLGYSALEPFIEAFPKRYLNVGVAEQNMVGVAAGLALSGCKVFVYSIANFPTLRCLEQIRTDVCYHKLDVTVVSVGAGFSYATQGYTHHGLEDIAVMRALPHMQITAPADPIETRLIVKKLCQQKGPAYLRLAKSGEPILHLKKPKITPGKILRLKSGSDTLIIATGNILNEALDAATILKQKFNIKASIWSAPYIKPIDINAIKQAAKKYEHIFTLEEAQIDGALGSAVAEVVSETSNSIAVLHRLGVPNTILHQAHT
ncbi:hypothetical protein BVY03_06020, partial [bacterium K02(2017)]